MYSVLHVLASPGAAAARLLPILADAAIKGVVVFAVASVAVMFCRRRSAATRHAIWAGAVLAQLILPVMSVLLPAWRVPLIDRLDQRFAPMLAPAATDPSDLVVTVPAPVPATPSVPPMPIVIAGGQGHGEGMAFGAGSAYATTRATRAAVRAAARAARRAREAAPMVLIGADDVRERAPGFNLLGTVRSLRNRATAWWVRTGAIVWLLGALAIFARFIAGTLAVSRLARRSERVEDGRWLSLTQRVATRLGVARPMTLLRSGRFGIPVTWGIVYPVVLLPDDADEWTDERRRYVLVHEMAHVKRVDAFTQLIAQLALAAFWFDPFVWIAAHRMRVEREHACDDYVLREGTPASTYAADLLAMVRALGSRGHAAQPAFAALAMARPDELEARMEAILDPAQERSSLRRAPALGLALCSLLLLVPLAAFRPVARPSSSFGGTVVAHAFGSSHLVEDPDFYNKIRDVQTELEARLAEAQPALEAAVAGVTAAHEARAAAAAAVAEASAAVAEASATTEAVATTAPTTPVVAARSSAWASGEGASCSSVSLRKSGTSTSIHQSNDDDNSSFQYISSGAGRCLQVAVWGTVEFSPDERSIRRVSPDGRFYIRERRERSDRELVVTAGDDDGPRYAYSVDGERASYDDEGRAWLENVLPDILRESGLNARQHVALLRRQGGIDAVLADIKRTQSTSAKRAAYDALLHQGELSDGDVEKLMRQAGSDLSESDGELSGLLSEMGKMGRRSRSMAEAMSSAVEHISSDGEKRSVLQQYALDGDRDMLVLAARQARSISSDGEKSGFLQATAKNYLSGEDESLRKAFFELTRTISSDGEKHAVLSAALPYAQRPSVLLAILDVAKEISSDGEKAEVLLSIAKLHLLTNPTVRESFMRVTRSLSSDGEYRRVMEAIVADR